MARRPPQQDIDEQDLTVDPPAHAAAGLTAVGITMKHAIEQMGVRRTAQTLLKLNQADGFDCQGCAWPDPDPSHRHTAEFCENGAKAVTEEATKRILRRDFFAAHPLTELAEKTDYWLGQQGRLTEPMMVRPGGTHYEPVSWDEAFATIGRHLTGLESPDQAIFYTSGKTSNEAAFAYQLFVRAFGTNNLPDCSNMCHESTSVGLAEVIGIGKGSVSLDDIHEAQLIVVAGQNPGTNHPRMLSALEIAKQNGAKIISINPLKEAGLVRFKNPQKVRGLAGFGTGLADLHLPVRINGDLALFQAIGALLLEWDAVDHEFVERHTVGFDAWAAHLRELDWDVVRRSTGLERAQIEEAARLFRDSSATVTCWAMGITQHRNAVATVKEIANLAFLQGNIGKPGAGLCPVRGHSNVQGDRTMGIWERPPEHFLDRCATSSASTRRASTDSTRSPRSRRCATARPGCSSGWAATSCPPHPTPRSPRRRSGAPSSPCTSPPSSTAPTSCTDRGADPPGARSQRAGPHRRPRAAGDRRGLHVGRTRLQGPAPAGVACTSSPRSTSSAPSRRRRIPGRHDLPWADFRGDYTEIRRRISRVVPGCEAYDEKVDRPGGFVLPHPPRDSRTFPTKQQKAIFTVSPTEVLHVPEGRLLLQTLRSHDQFNTTIYGLDDRYRGITNGRRVVFVHPDDITALGLAEGDHVDLVSEWEDGSERLAPVFRVVGYDQPRGCAAAYYPETNPLVPLDSKADGSNCPASKSVIVRLVPVVGVPTPQPSDAGAVVRGRRSAPTRIVATRASAASNPTTSAEHPPHWGGEQPGGATARGHVRGSRIGRGRGDEPARRTSRRAAGDAGAPYPPAARALADRRLVLRRPLRARRGRRLRWHVGGAAPAHRAADGELAVHRRGRAPRQHRHARDGASRRGQPDDRRPGDQPLRGLPADHAHPARRPAVGRAPGRRPAHRAGVRAPRPGSPVIGDGWTARVFLGSLLGETSPVSTYTPLLGAEVLLEPGTTLVLDVDATFEHGVLVDSGLLAVAGVETRRTTSPTSRRASSTLELVAGEQPVRLLLLGGPPFGEEIVMWWNIVARTHEEVVAWREDWQAQITRDGAVVADSQDVTDGRYGVVVGDHLPPIPAPGLPNARLRGRH